MLAAVCLVGCQATDVRRPLLGPLDDQIFHVDRAGTVRVVGTDPDGDPLTWSFELDPPPRTATRGEAGQPRLVPLPDGAIFAWTPGVADARGAREATYALRFVARSASGGVATETIALTVRDEGVGAAPLLRFASPATAGAAVAGPCAEIPVEVRTEAFAPDEVRLEAHAPGLECTDGAQACPTLIPAGPGTSKTLLWCPPADWLRASTARSIELVARAADVERRQAFLLLFEAPPVACVGEPPSVDHRPPDIPPGEPVRLRVAVLDDNPITAPPVLSYFLDPPPRGDVDGIDGVRRFRAVELERASDGMWEVDLAVEPPPGGQTTVYYLIDVVDDDDPDGDVCDHAVRSSVFSIRITSDGAVCRPDRFEPEPGADEQPTPLEPGAWDGLSICTDDVDLYTVPVAASDGIDVLLAFDGAAGDLDLALALPGEDDFSRFSLEPDADVEGVGAACVGVGGDALVAVFPYDDAQNEYRLEIRVQPGDCEAPR